MKKRVIRKKKEKLKLAAIGGYIFAGGFTVGVHEHFEVKAHLEEGPFGTATAKKNFPHLEIYDDPKSWPKKKEIGHVDFMFCNPPCAPWSSASAGRSTSWRDDPRTSCMKRCFAALKEYMPDAWAAESVRGVYTKGREMIDEMTEEAKSLGYKATYLLVNAHHHGVPQVRRRFFLVFHKYEIDWEATGDEEVPAGVVFARDPQLPSEPRIEFPERYLKYVQQMKPGEGLARVYDRVNARKLAKHLEEKKKIEAATGKAHKMKGRPGFLASRLRHDKPSSVITGGCTKYHPDEDRHLSVPEQAAMCGFPDHFEWEGRLGDVYAQIGKGVCPPVAEYLARMVKNAAIAKKKPESLDAEEAWIYSGHVTRKEPSEPGRADARQPAKKAEKPEPKETAEQAIVAAASRGEILEVDREPGRWETDEVLGVGEGCACSTIRRRMKSVKKSKTRRTIDDFDFEQYGGMLIQIGATDYSAAIRSAALPADLVSARRYVKHMRDLVDPSTGVVIVRLPNEISETALVEDLGMDKIGGSGRELILKRSEEESYCQKAFKRPSIKRTPSIKIEKSDFPNMSKNDWRKNKPRDE